MRRTHRTLLGCLLGTLLTLAMGRSGHAIQWTCAGGDSACLIAAMAAANTAPGSYAEHVIVLGAGLFVFVTPDPSAPTGDTALPLVTRGMTILGAGGEQTQLMRAVGGGLCPCGSLRSRRAARLSWPTLPCRGGCCAPPPPLEVG